MVTAPGRGQGWLLLLSRSEGSGGFASTSRARQDQDLQGWSCHQQGWEFEFGGIQAWVSCHTCWILHILLFVFFAICS